MNYKNNKKLNFFEKMCAISTIFTIFFINCGNVLATGIGTAEVNTATENIKRVITSIAMPLRWSTYFCKYCYSSNKNDSKRK